MRLDLVTLVVDDYDKAIEFFVNVLGFDLVEDSPGGRVAFFLQVDDFDEVYERIVSAQVPIVREPRSAPYGRVAVFLDCMGNPWDLVGPP